MASNKIVDIINELKSDYSSDPLLIKDSYSKEKIEEIMADRKDVLTYLKNNCNTYRNANRYMNVFQKASKSIKADFVLFAKANKNYDEIENSVLGICLFENGENFKITIHKMFEISYSKETSIEYRVKNTQRCISHLNLWN